MEVFILYKCKLPQENGGLCIAQMRATLQNVTGIQMSSFMLISPTQRVMFAINNTSSNTVVKITGGKNYWNYWKIICSALVELSMGASILSIEVNVSVSFH